jgi:hypothetical protein
MSQHSEDRLPTASFEETARSARIIPFERPQSDAQKAVQLRAQQEIDLKRSREESQKAPVGRWVLGFTVAMVPVLLLLGSVDGFLRVFHKINAMYESMPEPEQAPQVLEEPTQSEPGVVMLQPLDIAKPAPAPEAKK